MKENKMYFRIVAGMGAAIVAMVLVAAVARAGDSDSDSDSDGIGPCVSKCVQENCGRGPDSAECGRRCVEQCESEADVCSAGGEHTVSGHGMCRDECMEVCSTQWCYNPGTPGCLDYCERKGCLCADDCSEPSTTTSTSTSTTVTSTTSTTFPEVCFFQCGGCGDMDGDGDIDATDSLVVLRYAIFGEMPAVCEPGDCVVD